MKQRKVTRTTLTFDQMINTAPVALTNNKKTKKPTIVLNDVNSRYLEKYLNAKQAMKAAEGEMRVLEAPLLEYCTNYMNLQAQQGIFSSSYVVVSDDGKTSATFVSQDKFSLPQDEDSISSIKSILGEYENEIEEQPVVTLKPEVFQNEELKQELVTILGDKFGKFFQVTKRYTMKQGFAERIYKVASSNNLDVNELRQHCGQAKSYLK